MKRSGSHVCRWAIVLLAGSAAALFAAGYHSPLDLAYSPDGSLLAVTDHTAGRVELIGADGTTAGGAALRGRPAGVAWAPDGSRLFVAERGAGTVAELVPGTGKLARRFNVGRYPLAVAAGTTHLAVANNGINAVSIIELASGKETARVPDVYRPWDLALAPDGGTAVVGSLLPAGDARDATTACAVTLIDMGTGKKTAEIKLPAGSISLHGIVVSPDGKWAYAVHSLGRFTLPTTQLERGWVMTHAMSVIDLGTKKHYATVLLDLLMEGAADPWEIALSKDGATAWITLAGVHQIARLDLARLHLLMEGKAPKELLERVPKTSVWHRIAKDPDRRADLVNDLAALYGAGLIERPRIKAKGPRGIALAPDGKTLAVASYFGGDVLLLDAVNLAEKGRVALGPQPAPTAARLGEQHFFDAENCFQHWLSCASCHPEGRADGLNWDLLNDGIGNPKNAKSLVHSYRTPPVMSTGVRPSMEAATEKGFMFIQFRVVEDEHIDAVRAYLRSLRPDPSPFLVMGKGKKLACNTCHHTGKQGSQPKDHMATDGELTPLAKRGLTLFKDSKVGCVKCHPGPLFTDLKMYDVGTRHELDRRDDFDTPTCLETWRTAPLCHDGSAATLMDMLTTQNKADKHGKTSHLGKEDLEALVEYLRSL